MDLYRETELKKQSFAVADAYILPVQLLLQLLSPYQIRKQRGSANRKYCRVQQAECRHSLPGPVASASLFRWFVRFHT